MSDKESGGNLRNLHSTPENGLGVWEYGKGEGDGLNQNRPRRATRTAALRRAAGDRAGYLVTGRGGGAYAELSLRTTTGP